MAIGYAAKIFSQMLLQWSIIIIAIYNIRCVRMLYNISSLTLYSSIWPNMLAAYHMFRQDNARPVWIFLGTRSCHGRQVARLIPIEHLWDKLDWRLRHRQFRQTLQDEWVRIPQGRMQIIIQSKSMRWTAVIQAHVGRSRYWFWGDVFIYVNFVLINEHIGHIPVTMSNLGFVHAIISR